MVRACCLGLMLNRAAAIGPQGSPRPAAASCELVALSHRGRAGAALSSRVRRYPAARRAGRRPARRDEPSGPRQGSAAPEGASRFSLPVRAGTADGTGTARAPGETPDDPGGTPPGVNRPFPRPYVLGTVLAFRFRIGEPLSGNRASAFRDSVQGPASDAVRGGPSGRSRAPSSDRASAGPEVRGTRSSRTRVPYRREDDVISRVKLTCLTTV